MSRRLVFTPSIVPQITCWVNEGLTPEEIADKIGCKVSSLRVKCSQFQISLRRHLERKTSIRLREDQSENSIVSNGKSTIILPLDRIVIGGLRDQAILRGISETALAATLLEIIVRDGLYDAVLDDSQLELL